MVSINDCVNVKKKKKIVRKKWLKIRRVCSHTKMEKGKEGEEDEGEVKSKGRFSTLPTM